MLVIHQDSRGLKPGVAVIDGTEPELRDSVELILVDGRVTYAGRFWPYASFVMRHVQLPILKLSGSRAQTGPCTFRQ